MATAGMEASKENLLVVETARLEEQLQRWGDVLVAAERALRWEKPVYPVAIAGAVSLLFLVIYWLDPSLLTGVSTFVMTLCVVDFLLPTLTSKFLSPNHWTTDKQQHFNDVCKQLANLRRRLYGWGLRLQDLREEKPLVYLATVTVGLLVLAWIGEQFHNLLLTYMLVMSLLLLPGLNRHGVLSKYVGMARDRINTLLKRKDAKRE